MVSVDKVYMCFNVLSHKMILVYTRHIEFVLKANRDLTGTCTITKR